MRMTLLFRRRWVLFYAPIILTTALAIWLCAKVLMPLPPTTFTIAVPKSQGNMVAIALRYRDYLERSGIRAEIITTDSPQGPLERLSERAGDVEVAFGLGLQKTPGTDNAYALAAIEKHPVWIFTRQPSVTQVGQFKGLRIGIADADASANTVLQIVLANAQLSLKDVTVQAKSNELAANELIDGSLDVVVIVASSEADSVRLLSRNAAIQLIGVSKVSSVIAREPRLKAFVLPQGAIELRGDIPARDLTMLASNLHLLVKSGTHPALQRALIDASNEIHGTPGFLQRQGEFPNLNDMDFVASPVALGLAAGERPWMERLLPYRSAQLAELVLFAALPLVCFAIFLLTWVPRYFDWKANAILQNFYGELKFLETEITSEATTRPLEMKKLMQRLDTIEQQVALLDLPARYGNRWYTLREHLGRARERLLNLRAR